MSKPAGSALLLLLASCASATHHNIDFESTSASLYVEAPDGSIVKPLAGAIVDVDGIGLGRDAIRLLPGWHAIRHSCPALPEGILAAADWAPTIAYDFQAGRKYVLRCKDGGLVIALLPD